jgi:hypothetical protein
MSTYSKYNQISQKQIGRRKRTIQLPGSGEDDGKLYRCWYCGFGGNNIDRNAVGDGEGLAYSVELNDHDFIVNNAVGINIGTSGSAVLLSAFPVFTERRNVLSTAVAGCSFCASLNYR